MTESRRPARRGRPGPPRRPRTPPTPPPFDHPRRAVLDLLGAVRGRDAYANLVLPKMLRDRKITGRDAAFATELAYGTCRSQGLLDAVIAACIDRPLDEVDGDVLDALRMGAYQLLRTRVPERAAVASTVELVRVVRGSATAGFVNAVLRRIGKHDEAGWLAQVAPDPAQDPIGHLTLAHPHPRWIAEAFADALGPDAAELAAALAADDERPLVHLAARPGEISAEELAAATGGDEAPYSPYGVRLSDGGDPGGMDAVREHLAQVQDEGSQLVALAVVNAPIEGADARWLDLCAGPGGKAAMLGALAQSHGAEVVAVERAEHRAGLVEQACAGLPVQVLVADGRATELPAAGFDRVLVDAPCTGLGALRRRPEARWRRTAADLVALTRLQRELLLAALRLVRPGGVVGYATCSPHPDETTRLVADVVRRTGAVLTDARPMFPGVPHLGPGPHVQLWPHRHGTDAMFCALLQRA